MFNTTIIINFSNTKAAWIIYFFHAKHIVWRLYNFFYIILANSIAKCYQNFIIADQSFGKFYRMTGSPAFMLLHKMTGKIRIRLQYIVLDLIAKIPHHKNKFMNAGIMKLVNDK